MLLQNIQNKIIKYFLNFFLVQVIATFVSMPILAMWGMPISFMSILGNLLFSPLMTIFLVLSSFLFFTEILSIPNDFLAQALNYNTIAIEYCLRLGSKKWLVAVPFSSKVLLAIFPFACAIILLNKRIKNLFFKFGLVFCLTFFFIGFLKLNKKISAQTIMLDPIENKLTLNYDANNSITICDDGMFNKKSSIENYINFEITPFLVKKFGTTYIQELQLNKGGIRSLQAALELSKTFEIHKVKIKINPPKMNKKAWRLFYKLRRKIEKDDGYFYKEIAEKAAQKEPFDFNNQNL
ncbi:TPA: hypothetical protein DEO28_00555 [Candidatus Dependentiae bacterium]|nr:MAG: hypothetical protein UR14_C0001G0038 [candidate division TM6 bacterium GW2011_GWE2_31_21]KKP54082.1 MAG: hypothetical protein UR43_C0001G0100 [candidate division TM6 bacterium GW2011_GWF2_33_332]HBS48336.1 hypothetical protein [Candidatus Dependentiae bacterium]HBZ72990.1 hypothetical protein [Candidatus Dependentiae bacterium]